MNRRMKRFLCVLAVAVLALTSCEGFDINDLLGGGGDNTTDEPTTYDIVVEPSLLQFGAEGGEKAVEIEANVDYELLCEAEWVSYQVAENGAVVTVRSHTAKDKRKAMLVVFNKEYEIYKSVTIEQMGYIAPEEPETPEEPEKPETPEGPETPEITDAKYDRNWAEQPEKVENRHYIHKTYYSTLMDGKRVRNFSVCYDTVKMCSRWVAYPGHSVYRKWGSYQVGENNNKGRTNAWAFDDAVTEYAPSTDYNCAYSIVSKYDSKTDAYDTAREPIIPPRRQADICFTNGFGRGWARGHMLPSSQRYNTWENNAQTCYATNIMVQQYDFNSGS